MYIISSINSLWPYKVMIKLCESQDCHQALVYCIYHTFKCFTKVIIIINGVVHQKGLWVNC